MHVPDDVKFTIGRALGRIPSGVFILTMTQENEPLAMMVSWVQQAAFAPPSVSVAIAKERAAHAALSRPGAAFALSVLPEGDTSLMKKYARGVPAGADPFEGVRTTRTANGAVVLADALAYLECRVKASCAFDADHDVFLAEVVAGQMLNDGASFTHLRGNGFHY
ncbi:MAG TPA: flavin reductase family protein [Tepidisphaeraceae bacterium]|nr:flavin reductase family protein [Tepidisphaeraceae bacterium]